MDMHNQQDRGNIEGAGRAPSHPDSGAAGGPLTPRAALRAPKSDTPGLLADSDPADAPHANPPRVRARALPWEECEDSPASRRSDGWTPERRVRFLEALSRDGSVRDAAAQAGLSARSAYQLRARDSAFAALWAGALELARPQLADTLWSRALDGVWEESERFDRDGARVLLGRRRIDNRLGLQLLARLDKTAPDAAAGRVAARWDRMMAAAGAGREGTLLASLVFGSDTPPRPGRAKSKHPPSPIVIGPDGRPWTDLPPAAGWAGTRRPRADVTDLPAPEDDGRDGAFTLRTLDAEEQAAWDEREALYAAHAAAADTVDRTEGLTRRDDWLSAVRAETAELEAELRLEQDAEAKCEQTP